MLSGGQQTSHVAVSHARTVTDPGTQPEALLTGLAENVLQRSAECFLEPQDRRGASGPV